MDPGYKNSLARYSEPTFISRYVVNDTIKPFHLMWNTWDSVAIQDVAISYVIGGQILFSNLIKKKRIKNIFSRYYKKCNYLNLRFFYVNFILNDLDFFLRPVFTLLPKQQYIITPGLHLHDKTPSWTISIYSERQHDISFTQRNINNLFERQHQCIESYTKLV